MLEPIKVLRAKSSRKEKVRVEERKTPPPK
jgi:hypothetical protein